MNYENIVIARFVDRPNRFIAHCIVNGKTETVHVKNTGRCKELLTDNAVVYLEKSNNPNRKTQYDLIAVEKNGILINMDSQAPNKVVYEWLCKGNYINNPTIVKPESKFQNSRFDFYLENESEKAFVEVKGVTLEDCAKAMFPDAPTQRGYKHINELIDAKKAGYKAAVLFVIQMKGCKSFSPNYNTDPDFCNALKKAKENGVDILTMDCIVTPNTMKIDKKVNIDI